MWRLVHYIYSLRVEQPKKKTPNCSFGQYFQHFSVSFDGRHLPPFFFLELVAARSSSAFTQLAENTPTSVLHAARLGPCRARRCWFSMTLLTVSLVAVARL